MSRIPASAGVALAGLLPMCAAALGLGEVESKSYLNQPLAAEIPVFAEASAELAGLSVNLASPDTFAQYGLQRPAFLGDLAFTVAPAPRGGVIRITSARPVTEPFVTLLLEVQWPQGRLLREYTVLLDPPAFTGGAVRQPVQAPAAAPAPAPRAAAAGEAAVPAAPPVASAGAETHVVQRNETLWRIADRYRPASGADINQVMMAIYRANPEAFAGNINRLNAGAVLRIPDQVAIAATARSEADAEVRRQTQAWAGSAAAAAPARLELVPPAESAGAGAPATAPAAAPAPATSNPKLASEVEESRRLLAVKDAELQALRKRVADLEKQGGEVAVETPAPAPAAEPAAEAPQAAPAPAPEASAPAPAAPAAAESAKPARPVRARPPEVAGGKAAGGGLLGTIGQLLTSLWLWLAAAVVLIGALLVARRRSAAEQPEPWRPTTARGRGEDADTSSTGENMIVIEERPQATGGFERRAVPRGEEETPLERTISTEGPVNLDQSDPLAEAEFHVAYGLYDQAADILTAAISREPTRRDLQLKLLDVYFGWENREGFLKQARALRERVGTDDDPDWKRVSIMGRQLCPGEALFAGAAAPAAEDMDLAFGGDDGGNVDLALGGDDAGLDFDLSDSGGLDADADAATTAAQPWGAAQTQEIPTIEAPGPDVSPTMETPTIESAQLSSTMETPTIQTRSPSRTMETPTIEAPGIGGTARLQGLSSDDERHDQTAEIDLEDLGLDLTGLDEAASDMSTGLQESLPGGEGLDFDLSAAAGAGEGEESTAEMEGSPTLNQLGKAMGKGAARGPQLDDTAEQPRMADAGDTMATQRLSATSDELESLDIDLNFSEADAAGSDLTATGLKAIGGRRPEDPTMTEVGTKLDLARAYVDMGDPDGARSILNEVLEEGDPEQRQEARHLLDGLDG